MGQFQGRDFNYMTSLDGSDPDSVVMLFPSDPEEQGNARFQTQNDNLQIDATNVKLPVTFYVALTNGNLDEAADSLLSDLELQAGPGGPDAARFGNFELSVQEN
jgi:hypothetical protein